MVDEFVEYSMQSSDPDLLVSSLENARRKLLHNFPENREYTSLFDIYRKLFEAVSLSREFQESIVCKPYLFH